MSPSGHLDFHIQEGIKVDHTIRLDDDLESLDWGIQVLDGYDIECSIRIKCLHPGSEGAWIFLEPQRLGHLTGRIDAGSLAEDRIKLPVQVEFRLDNTYSWFNPKKVHLTLTKSSSSNVVEHLEAARDELCVREESPQITGDESPRRREVRTRSDLLWINQVVGEALVRCPSSAPEIRQKLEEVKALLKPCLSSVSRDVAII